MVFRTAFDFLNAHFPPPENAEEWKQFSIDTSKASEKARGGVLVDGFLTVIGDYLEEEYKKRKGDNNG